jgi:hypothetical protein
MPARPHWSQHLVWALLFVPATLFLFVAQTRQPVDPSNRALKIPDSRDAENLRALTEVVSDDSMMLLAFEVPGGFEMLPGDRERIEACRQRLAAMPGVASCRSLPSPEPGLVLCAVALRDRNPGALAQRILDEAKSLAPPSLRVLASSLPLVESHIARLVADERVHIVPWIVVALLLSAMVFYRHPGVAVATLLPALAGIVWTSGLVALLGHPLDPVAALLDPVLLTIGVAASVHFVESWRRGRAQGLDERAAAAFACRDQYQPAFLATVTTMVGLLSLYTSQVPAVVDFGVRAAFGVALVHAFTFAILPAWLPFACKRAPAATDRLFPAAWMARLQRSRAALLAGTAAVSCLGLAVLPALHADNDPLRMLPPTDACRLDHEHLAARLGGVETFHLLIPARTPGTEPARLLPFLAALHEQPGVASLAGPVQRGPEGDLAAPVLLRPAGSAVRAPLFGGVERAARVLGMDSIVPGGASVRIARDSELLMRSLLGSLWITLALLFAGMCLGLRSIRLGLLGMVPNLLPCIWIYGFLAWTGRPVSVATAMIGCTMLGLIVDNTLHLLHHFGNLRRAEAANSAAVEALRHCGRGMALSSVMLLVGFGVTATSRLSTTVEFSLLACSIIAAALWNTVVVLPLLLTRTEKSPGGARAM